MLNYVVAAGCILAAFSIRYFLTPWLGEELPFMLFIAAALVAAWYGGAAAGTVALLLGLFLADYFFLRKEPSERLEVFRIVRYLFSASLGIALIEVLHRNHRQLEREIDKREASEAALQQAHAQLKEHACELDQKVAERTAQLSATVEALRNVLYQIAHHFRAPLRAVRGYGDILTEEYAPRLDGRAKEYCRRMCDAAKRMDGLIQDLLEYGRLGHVEVETTAVSLDEVMERVILVQADEIEAQKAQLEVVRPLPQVWANAIILERVLSNLIENGLKFVRLGTTPRIRVRAELRDSRVRIWVEDNGIGIEPCHQKRIFRPFEILDPRQPGSGTGMGLAVVKEGVDRIGGEWAWNLNWGQVVVSGSSYPRLCQTASQSLIIDGSVPARVPRQKRQPLRVPGGQLGCGPKPDLSF